MISKKGYVFELVLVIFTLATLVTLIYLVVNDPFAGKRDQYKDLGLGRPALQLFHTYQNAEKVLLYLDTAAIYTGQKTVVQLAKGGGYAGRSTCGVKTEKSGKKEYNMWNNEKEWCFPKPGKEFPRLFEGYLANALNDYPKDAKGYSVFPEGGYIVTLYRSQLIGSARTSLSFVPEGAFFVQYEVEPSFSVPLGYNSNEYDTVKGQAGGLESCSSLPCVTEKIKEFGAGFKWASGDCDFKDFVACFEVTSPTKFISSEPIVYRFAMYIDLPAPKIVDVKDNKEASNSVVVSFEKLKKDDIKEYIVYAGPEQNIKEKLARGETLLQAVIAVKDITGGQGEGVAYYTTGGSGAVEVRYMFSSSEIKDELPLYYAVAAVNNDGRQSPISESVRGVSSDDAGVT